MMYLYNTWYLDLQIEYQYNPYKIQQHQYFYPKPFSPYSFPQAYEPQPYERPRLEVVHTTSLKNNAIFSPPPFPPFKQLIKDANDPLLKT